jgi:hypothetical protein
MKQAIGMGALSKFIKARLGYGGKDGCSPYYLAALALEKDGLVKPDDVSYKRWIENNIDAIFLVLGKKVDKKEKKKQKQRLIKENSTNFNYAKSNDFLKTYEWRKVRMEVLKKHGARCQCCGASPKEGIVLNVDHIKPRKLFPHLALDINNLQVLCAECNHGKGNWDQTDWR